MPYNRRGSYGRRRRNPMVVVNSIKNQTDAIFGLTDVRAGTTVAKAVNTPLSTVSTDVSNGCIIKAIWISLDVCGLSATGVLAQFHAYLFKNPGNSLTPPLPGSVGTSNEKKFVIKSWSAMTMRNQDGNPPYHWEGWIKIPKRYHRMGTDDTWSLQFAMSAATTGHGSFEAIYKWFR